MIYTKAKIMAGRKINVVSNKRDHAPKNRAAWYGKVILSMKKEITEAMDVIFVDWSDILVSYIYNHKNNIPYEQILKLRPGDSLSFEIKREKIEYGWFRETAWPWTLQGFYNFSHNWLRASDTWELKPGEKSLIIVVKTNPIDSKSRKIHAEQLEWAKSSNLGGWALINEGMFYHDPNVSDKKFQDIVWDDDEKDEE